MPVPDRVTSFRLNSLMGISESWNETSVTTDEVQKFFFVTPLYSFKKPKAKNLLRFVVSAMSKAARQLSLQKMDLQKKKPGECVRKFKRRSSIGDLNVQKRTKPPEKPGSLAKRIRLQKSERNCVI